MTCQILYWSIKRSRCVTRQEKSYGPYLPDVSVFFFITLGSDTVSLCRIVVDTSCIFSPNECLMDITPLIISTRYHRPIWSHKVLLALVLSLAATFFCRLWSLRWILQQDIPNPLLQERAMHWALPKRGRVQWEMHLLPPLYALCLLLKPAAASGCNNNRV